MAKKESNEDKLVNIQAASLAAQVAQMAAQLEFQKERFRLLELPQYQHASQMDIDRLAFDKANSEFEHAFQEASVTGMYNGVPTIDYLTKVAQMTGVINGQQTLEGKLSDAQIAQINATIMNTQRGMDLEYLKYGTDREQWDAEHQMAVQKQQADLTGYINGLPTFEREQWQANQGQAYLNLLGSLRGPENAFAQLKVLRNSPNALQEMAQSWAGQFMAPGGAGLNPPTPVTPQNMMSAQSAVPGQPGQPGQPPPYAPGMSSTYHDPSRQNLIDSAANPGMQFDPVTGKPVRFPGTTQAPVSNRIQEGVPQSTTYAQAAPQAAPQVGVQGYTIDPPGAPASADAYNYQGSPGGGVAVHPPGVQAPAAGTQVSTYQPLSPAQQQQAVAAASGAQPGVQGAIAPYNPGVGGTGVNFVDPSKINARNYNQESTYGKELGWAGYEDVGWDKEAAKEVFKRSLPKYGVSKEARGTVKV